MEPPGGLASGPRYNGPLVDEAAGQPILAIDLGGTQIRAAYVSPDLRLAAGQRTPTIRRA